MLPNTFLGVDDWLSKKVGERVELCVDNNTSTLPIDLPTRDRKVSAHREGELKRCKFTNLSKIFFARSTAVDSSVVDFVMTMLDEDVKHPIEGVDAELTDKEWS